MLYVHLRTSLIRIVSGLKISSLRRVANWAACNCSLGIDLAFIGATRALPRMSESLVS